MTADEFTPDAEALIRARVLKRFNGQLRDIWRRLPVPRPSFADFLASAIVAEPFASELERERAYTAAKIAAEAPDQFMYEMDTRHFTVYGSRFPFDVIESLAARGPLCYLNCDRGEINGRGAKWLLLKTEALRS